MPGESAKEWGVIPPTPPYRDQPSVSEAAHREVSRYVGTCRNKKRYKMLGHANCDARIINARQEGKVVVYVCGYCSQYHIGSEDKKQASDAKYRKDNHGETR
jgi:hypothetical protein